MNDPIKHPPSEVVNKVLQILEERNIFIPPEHVDTVVAVMCHWLSTSRRGVEFMAHIMRLDVKQGRTDKEYILIDEYDRIIDHIDSNRLHFFRGIVLDSTTPIPFSRVIIDEKIPYQCMECGASVVCGVRHKREHDNFEKLLCSNCLSHGELEDREKRDFSCDSCDYVKCDWHPSNLDVPPSNYLESI